LDGWQIIGVPQRPCSADERNAAVISTYLGLDRVDWFLLEEATRRQLRDNRSAVRTVADELRKRGALSGVMGTCTVVDKAANIKVKCTKVTAVVQSGNSATIFGEATVNGTATTFRIDFEDNAEPGKGSDIFKIQTGSGYSAGGTLTQGNIQVHEGADCAATPPLGSLPAQPQGMERAAKGSNVPSASCSRSRSSTIRRAWKGNEIMCGLTSGGPSVTICSSRPHSVASHRNPGSPLAPGAPGRRTYPCLLLGVSGGLCLP
jgi:hypothetical protein